MSCTGCSQVKEISPVQSGLIYELAPGVTTVEDKRGNLYQIRRPLITRPHSPKRGWSVVFQINGQKHELTGSDPVRIFAAAQSLFDLNAVEYTDLNLWFNLNLQWLERAIEKYQNVTYADLIKLAL